MCFLTAFTANGPGVTWACDKTKPSAETMTPVPPGPIATTVGITFFTTDATWSCSAASLLSAVLSGSGSSARAHESAAQKNSPSVASARAISVFGPNCAFLVKEIKLRIFVSKSCFHVNDDASAVTKSDKFRHPASIRATPGNGRGNYEDEDGQISTSFGAAASRGKNVTPINAPNHFLEVVGWDA